VPAPETPLDSPLTMVQALASPLYRDLSTPKVAVGDPAFDFELPRCDFSDGARRATGETVCLADFAGVSPVALVFGSYT
jgi:hypothetical protein